MKRLPITVRLTVAFAAAMLLVLLAAALFVALRLRADLDDQVDNNLRGPKVTGEVAALEWIRDRLPLDGDQDRTVDEALVALRTASDRRSLAAAADHATRIASLVRDLSVR